MENNITNWKNLWIEEQPPTLDISLFIKQINTIEQKSKLERIILTIAVPITIVVLIAILPVFSNVYYLIAVSIMSLGMLLILGQSYRSKTDLIKRDSELNNLEFIEYKIDKLKEKMLTTSRYMWIYAILLIIGLNIGYIDILEKFNLPLPAKIITNFVLSAVMLYLFDYGISQKKKQHNKTILPLIEFLKSLK